MEENKKNLGEVQEHELEKMTGDVTAAGGIVLSAISFITAITPNISYAYCPTGTGCTINCK